ncbi:MAG: DUF2812 domain-containing protein [Anaerovoracaceae bacterium]
MRYKLQTWEYDIFSNEEAECHLEEMAEKGWALFKITQEWMPIACYRREAAAAGRRYAVTAVPDDAEDFFRMCEDAGWKKIVHLGNWQCVLAADDPKTGPLFSDRDSQYSHELEMIQDSGNLPLSGEIIGLIVLILLFLFMDLSILDPRPCVILTACIPLLLFKIAADAIELLFLRRAARLARSGIDIKKPVWLRRSVTGLNKGTTVIVLAMIAFELVWFVFLQPSLTGSLAVLAILPLFLAGFYLRVIKEWKVLGVIMMFLGAFLFYAGISLIG